MPTASAVPVYSASGNSPTYHQPSQNRYPPSPLSLANLPVTMADSVTLGTRRSILARLQTDLVSAALTESHPSLTISVNAFNPLGDRDKSTALYKLASGEVGKSVWTGEFEDLLAAGELDAIVHSCKDMPTTLPTGLVLGAVLQREDPRDVLVLPKGQQSASAQSILTNMPDGAIIGTSSLRRMAQLRRRYPALRFEIARGNVETRLKKLDDPKSFTDQVVPDFAALILAAAGLKRLGLQDRISAYFSSHEEHGGMLHAVGQGAIAVEARGDDQKVAALLQTINHVPTYLAISAERALMRHLEGGCSVPIGVETTWQDQLLHMKAVVVSIDGTQSASIDVQDTVTDLASAEALGVAGAKKLVAAGAAAILNDINAERRRGQAQAQAESAVQQQTSSST